MGPVGAVPPGERDPVCDPDQLAGGEPVQVSSATPAGGGAFVDTEGGGVVPGVVVLPDLFAGFAPCEGFVVGVREDCAVLFAAHINRWGFVVGLSRGRECEGGQGQNGDSEFFSHGFPFDRGQG